MNILYTFAQKTYNMDIEKKVKSNFVKFPDRVRDKNSSGIGSISTKTKFIYLVISWHQYSNSGKSPSFKMMKETFGVNRKTYIKALEELHESCFIDYKRDLSSGSIDINIIGKDKSTFSMIPTAAILTRTLTNSHKVFVAIMWKMFVNKRKRTMSEICITTNEIVKETEKIGFSKNYIYKYVNELSSPDSGYINVFTRNKNTYKINFENLLLMLEYEYFQRDIERKSRNKFIYVSPVPFEYIIDENDFNIIRNKEFENATTKMHKKLISDIDFVNNL